MARLTRLSLLSVAGSLLLATACGGSGSITLSDSGPSSGPSPSHDAPKAAEAPYAPVATLASIRSAGRATNAVSSGRFEFRMEGDGEVLWVTSGEFSGDRARESTSMEGLQDAVGAQETVIDGGDIYFRGGLVAQLLPIFDESAEADGWIRVAGFDGEMAHELGQRFTGPDGLGEQTAQLLEGAYGDVTVIGEEDVRGSATTHSRVEVDMQQVSGAVEGGLLDGMFSGTFPIDVWIDGDGRLVRASFGLSAALGAFGSIGGSAPDLPQVTATFETWDLGAPIEVEVPANARTIDLAEMFGR